MKNTTNTIVGGINNSLVSSVLALDYYKLSHREQYPEGTTKVYSTWTPRSSKFLKGVPYAVAFGLQYFIKENLIKAWNEGFFSRPKEEVISEYKRIYERTLGREAYTKHLEDLHDLGYLPLKITAVPEGKLVPIRVPMVTIENTDKRFFWLTNYIETIFSNNNWQPSTSATISMLYRVIADYYAERTADDLDAVPFQCHDFSMRGMSSEQSSALSGMGHLLSFVGTDTVPSILYAEHYYGANVDTELVGTSIPATEHSVCSAACGDGENHIEDEVALLTRLLTEVYPTGLFSYVSDTYSLWDVLDIVSSDRIKPLIMNREGRIVIRPDSGDPVRILTGYTEYEIATIKHESTYLSIAQIHNAKRRIGCADGWMYAKHEDAIVKWHKGKLVRMSEYERKGVVESLWDIFGGTVNSKGFKRLDTHVGTIYGDAITPERMIAISSRLEDKGFASTNVVYGVGSMSFQLRTRDTLGFAIKSTYCESESRGGFALFKDPITDDGIKTSQYGRVEVRARKDNGIIIACKDERNYTCAGTIPVAKNTSVTGEDLDAMSENILRPVFEDGKLLNEITFSQVRENLKHDMSDSVVLGNLRKTYSLED